MQNDDDIIITDKASDDVSNVPSNGDDTVTCFALSEESEAVESLDKIKPEDEEPNIDSHEKKAKKKPKGKKHNYWPLIITGITFVLSLTFSFVSEMVTNGTGIAVAIILLAVLILISIIFDGIGVSVTSCDLAPLNSMAARKVPHAKVAIVLVKNASKVNNICADVIGDICGIVSGACGAALVASIMAAAEGINDFVLAIFVSAFIAAFTVGGKAFEKTIAIKNSQQIVMMAARVIGVFYRPEKKRKNNARKNKQK